MTIASNWYENFFHGVALDLWAADRGYAKVELNLLGL